MNRQNFDDKSITSQLTFSNLLLPLENELRHFKDYLYDQKIVLIILELKIRFNLQYCKKLTKSWNN